METSISTLFHLRKDKMNKQKQVPIYLRITIDGRRFEWSTQRYIDLVKWSQPAEKVKGTTEESKSINAFGFVK